MDVSTAIQHRISTRAFLDKAISKTELEDWLTTAQRAPSGGNLQPWRVIALAGDEKQAVTDMAVETLAGKFKGEPTDRPVYPPDLWEPYDSRRRVIGEQMYAALDIPRENKPARMAWFANNFRFFGAPVALFIVLDERMGHGQWGHTGMFLQTLSLLAVERGWASCMQECWAILRPSLKAHLGLGDTEMVWCGMALGYADKDAPVNSVRSGRAELEEFVEFRGF